MHHRTPLAVATLAVLAALVAGCTTRAPDVTTKTPGLGTVPAATDTAPAVTGTVPAGDLVTVPDLLRAVTEWVTRAEVDPHDPEWDAKAIKALEPLTAPLGLKVRITWAKAEAEGMYQRPRAGERVPRGTTVELHLIGEV